MNIKYLDFMICLTKTEITLEKKGKLYSRVSIQDQDENFISSALMTTKKAAIIYYMIERPTEFSRSIVDKLLYQDGGVRGEYIKFCEVVSKEDLSIPEEITSGGITKDHKEFIYFNGQPINGTALTTKNEIPWKDIIRKTTDPSLS